MFVSLLRWLDSSGPHQPSAGPDAASRRPHLGLEPLEDRLVPSTISGFVYDDLNHNGFRDPGEPGIATSQVQLINSAGQAIAWATTDATGAYAFTIDQSINTQPTTQEVDALFADQKTNSTQTQTVAQFDPSLGTLTGVDLVLNGHVISTIQAESLDPTPTTIEPTTNGTLTLTGGGATDAVTLSSDQKINVPAFDGTLDFGGSSGFNLGPQTTNGSQTVSLVAGKDDLSAFQGTGNVTLTLNAQATSCVCGSGNVASEVNTVAGGKVQVIYHYTPSNAIKPGNYTVQQISQPPGLFEGTNTINNTTPVAPYQGGEYIPITLPPGGDSTDNNFGELRPSSIYGIVYDDCNENGVVDSGETGLAGVSLILTGTDDHGNAVTAYTITDANGWYGFANLRPGTYTVSKTSTPTGDFDDRVTPGTAGGVVVGESITQIGLNEGTTLYSYNFAEVEPAKIGGYVYLDKNQNGVADAGDVGLAGVTLTLQGQNDLGQMISMTTVTGSDGSYSFTGLRPGTYAVTKTPPQGYLDGQVNLGNLGGSVVGNTYWVALTCGDFGYPYNFSELLPATPPPPPTPTIPPTPTPPVTPQTPGGTPTLTPTGVPSKLLFLSDSWMWGL